MGSRPNEDYIFVFIDGLGLEQKCVPATATDLQKENIGVLYRKRPDNYESNELKAFRCLLILFCRLDVDHRYLYIGLGSFFLSAQLVNSESRARLPSSNL